MRAFEGVDLDLPAIGRGAVLGLLIVAPASLVDLALSAVDGLDEGILVFLLFTVILAAFFLAGYRGAREAAGSPYTHGALAALAAFGLWLPLRVVTRVLIGEQPLGREGDALVDVVEAVATSALLALSCGILGGLVASRRSRPR